MESFKTSWQKCTLDILSDFAKKNNSIPIKNTVSLTYRKYPNGFYVNSDNLINNPKQIAKYIGRYLARPAIAEYRITFFNSSIVKFWFKNPDSNNKIFLTLDINTFIGRLLAHIPPSNFKMVRRFGIYSRNSNIKKPMNFRIFIPKLHGLKKFLRLMELILWFAINVIQLLPLLKFFIALMVSYFQKTHLHKLKTSFFSNHILPIWFFVIF